MVRRTAQLLVLLAAAGVGAAWAQGTFGHLAYGGGWQTTFLIVNEDQTTEADVSLSFYSNSGTPLAAPVNGATAIAVYSFSILPGGSASVLLPDVGGSTVNEGWASLAVSNTPTVSGQAIFRQNLGGGNPVLEAAVPFTTFAPVCLVPYGSAGPTHYILVPFDNTTGVHVTALALANTTSSGMTVPVEFDDPTGTSIVSGTLTLGAMNHTSFVTTTQYPATQGKTGVLRITLTANIGDLSVLALLADSTAGTLTTLIPITQ